MDNISYHLFVSHPKIFFTDVLYTSIVSTEILEFTRGSIYPTKMGVGNNSLYVEWSHLTSKHLSPRQILVLHSVFKYD